MKRINLLKKSFIFALSCFFFMSCYSVFSGGTGGQLVDAESVSNPKAGIANADIYAYTSEKDRDADFNGWAEGSVFVPKADYYGHTTSRSDGSFTISKLVWKAAIPDFGKDADYTQIYLLFYHENYGLTKGESLIMSDSTSDTVYAELTKIRKETVINLNFFDVAYDSNTVESVYAEISVPQTTNTIKGVSPKVYKVNVSGSGMVAVSYPRWRSDSDKSKKIENTPEVKITYYQNADIITWQGCYNGDNEAKDYSFRIDENGKTVVSKIIGGSSYNATLYGKNTRFNVPAFSGQWGTDNGVTLNLLQSVDNGSTYTVDCGSVETESQLLGTNGTEKKGCFNNLGYGHYWYDYSYTGKTTSGFYKISDGSSSITREVPSNRNSVLIQK